MRSSPALLLTALLALPAVGCAHKAPPPVEVPSAPPTIADLDGFEDALNHYALLPLGHDARPEYRAALIDFLVGHLDAALARGDEDEAEASLRFALSMYAASELRSAAEDPTLAAAAHRLYQHAAKHGDEIPSLLALVTEQRFGDEATRTRALADWEALEAWLVDNGPFSSEPLLAHEELERSLETVAATAPTPFVVQRLADLYVARFDAAKRAHSQGGGLGNTSLRRVEITGYLLMRLYLRADDPEGAIEAMKRVSSGEAVDQLAEILEDALKSRRSARPLLSLAEQFIPEEDADPSLPYVSQSWGIIDNLSRRALTRYPKDPYVHLMRAQVLRESGLNGAALHHLRRSVELKDDVFETWQQLAELEQIELADLARRDAAAALVRLGEVEAMHQRAMKLWRDRPIRPALPDAYFTVAEGLYQAGRVDDAEGLLDKSLKLEAQPRALDLLGTIALKRSRFGAAQAHYEDLARLPYEEEEIKLRWEARARGQLGEIALRSGDPEASTSHFRTALRQTNELLMQPATTARAQADRYLERGRLLFFLGEVELATDDFEYAGELAPDHVGTYAEPMLQLVSHGYYHEALDVFHRAMDSDVIADGLKLYFCLWLGDLALRQGLAPDAEVTAFLEQYSGDDSGDEWGRRLARHARGDLSYGALLKAASSDGQRTEAFFYEGLRRWRDGDVGSAKELLRKVVDSELMGFFEYDMAQAYLSWEDVPVKARPPTMGGVARRDARR